MEQDVTLQVITYIRHPYGEEDRMTFQGKGKLYLKDESVYLRYEEQLEDLGKTATIVQWKEAEKDSPVVTIIRQGDVSMKQVFEKGKTWSNAYLSPYGRLELEMITHQVKIEKEWLKGKIYLSYDVYIDQQKIGHYQVEIEYQEERGILH
ncbi:DUF1934 domain-containing protein [Tepidibacillus infernus]|uniref:DUF1934 domain-containing protein n=1 Tax=Tepidibacillus decaturensis TaxID=1413211 RepID=A0A135L781_9BACI|nr:MULTISPECIES: DUF1934 domain-containing protein [Tepidibacillus]KXG44683.1 hypothetical protein U473_12105 [Tepidibacillus decaturensis]GBF12498.1 putative beta-barrel protein YwiB [Tepidibacillus sp. HK-1]